MAQHPRLKVDAYSCDPQSPWQTGANANTNGLLRQYCPRATELSTHSACTLAAVAATPQWPPPKDAGVENTEVGLLNATPQFTITDRSRYACAFGTMWFSQQKQLPSCRSNPGVAQEDRRGPLCAGYSRLRPLQESRWRPRAGRAGRSTSGGMPSRWFRHPSGGGVRSFRLPPPDGTERGGRRDRVRSRTSSYAVSPIRHEQHGLGRGLTRG